jgi:hypothetical protein
MGRRANARENEGRQRDRFTSPIVLAASIICAVQLARAEILGRLIGYAAVCESRRSTGRVCRRSAPSHDIGHPRGPCLGTHSVKIIRAS